MKANGHAPMNRAWLLERYPQGEDFSGMRLAALPIPELAPDEALVKTLYLSLDPGHRTWMREEGSYMPALTLGQPMIGGILGQVVESKIDGLAPGELVSGLGQWAEYSVFRKRRYTTLESTPDVPLTAALSVLGATGWTAYFGLLDIGRPKAGETLVVSAAAGAVGSIAGQIGKIMGCRVVGIAGTAEKCRWLTAELGFDAAIDYSSENIDVRLRELCPKGVDVYFENVGGKISEAVYANLAINGRVILCGLVAGYNQSKASELIDLAPLLMKRVRIESFIVVDYFSRTPDANRQIREWLKTGQLKYRVEVIPGIENALQAFLSLLQGSSRHSGKLLVQVADKI
jgi:NADPH-dependent curcumin reductase CurA